MNAFFALANGFCKSRLLGVLVVLSALAVLPNFAAAQSSAGYPWLVTAVDTKTGKWINPVGARTETEARERADYLNSLPDFYNAKYYPNPNRSGASSRPRTPPRTNRSPRRTPTIGSRLRNFPGRTSPGRTPTAQPRPPTPAERLRKAGQGTLSGNESLNGYGRLQFRLFGGNGAQMIDKDGTTNGKWEITGTRIALRFYNGSVRYYGTLTGNGVRNGVATNGRARWTWNVTIRP